MGRCISVRNMLAAPVQRRMHKFRRWFIGMGRTGGGDVAAFGSFRCRITVSVILGDYRVAKGDAWRSARLLIADLSGTDREGVTCAEGSVIDGSTQR
jgi:hypothetical protein